MLKIVFVTPEFITEKESGGLGTYIYNISRALSDLGHKITIITKSDESEYIDEYYPNISLSRVRINTENRMCRDTQTSIVRYCSSELKKEVIRINNGFGIDIIQYPNWNAYSFDRIDVPTVVRISSDQALWRASGRLDYVAGNEYKPVRAMDWLEDICMMRADAVFGPSRQIANTIERRLGTSIPVIESPFYFEGEVDNTLFPKELNGKNYILTHGTLKLMKGTKLIADSIKELLKRFPNMYYVFAGACVPWGYELGEEIDPVEYIKEQAGEYKNRVIYLGKLRKEELLSVISNASAIVLPSRVDNLPNACIEAMALGGVVIGTRGASYEQLINDNNGFLMNPEDGDSLLEAITKAISLNNSDRKQIGAEAKKTVARMEPSIIATQLEKFYLRVIRGYRQKINSEYFSCAVRKYNEIIGDVELKIE